MAREHHDIIMGRADDSLVVEFRPALGPQATIDVTQVERPRFGYQSQRLTPTENSTLINFDGAQASDEEAIKYVRTLTTHLRRPIALLGRLVSIHIPEMALGKSLFDQREEIVTGVGPASPSIELLMGEGDESVREDISEFDRLVGNLVVKIADPYSDENGAFAWGTIGQNNAAHAQMVNHQGVHVELSYHGELDTKTIREQSGVEMPDGSLHTFVGANGMVLRIGERMLACKTGPERKVPFGIEFPVRALIDRALYSIVSD